MTDYHKVYTEVLKTLKIMMKMAHQGYVVTLVMTIADPHLSVVIRII